MPDPVLGARDFVLSKIDKILYVAEKGVLGVITGSNSRMHLISQASRRFIKRKEETALPK